MVASMRIDIWSDVVCVWCYLGERRLERALAQFEHRDRVRLVFHSFQLDPSYPKASPEPASSVVAKKMGVSADQVRAMADGLKDLASQEGLEYDFERAIVANTFDAHRLTHLAKTYDLGGEMHQRLMHAHFAAGESVDDPATLVRIAADVGVPAEAARGALAGDEYALNVEDDIRQAGALGVQAVPFLLVDGAYRISGAQSVGALLSALQTADRNAAEPMPNHQN